MMSFNARYLKLEAKRWIRFILTAMVTVHPLTASSASAEPRYSPPIVDFGSRHSAQQDDADSIVPNLAQSRQSIGTPTPVPSNYHPQPSVQPTPKPTAFPTASPRPSDSPHPLPSPGTALPLPSMPQLPTPAPTSSGGSGSGSAIGPAILGGIIGGALAGLAGGSGGAGGGSGNGSGGGCQGGGCQNGGCKNGKCFPKNNGKESMSDKTKSRKEDKKEEDDAPADAANPENVTPEETPEKAFSEVEGKNGNVANMAQSGQAVYDPSMPPGSATLYTGTQCPGCSNYSAEMANIATQNGYTVTTYSYNGMFQPIGGAPPFPSTVESIPTIILGPRP